MVDESFEIIEAVAGRVDQIESDVVAAGGDFSSERDRLLEVIIIESDANEFNPTIAFRQIVEIIFVSASHQRVIDIAGRLDPIEHVISEFDARIEGDVAIVNDIAEESELDDI